MLFAKTSKALDRMNKLFKQRTIQKTYWAVVKNSPPHAEGQLAHCLVKNPETNIVTPYEKEVPGSLFSELSYRVLQKTEHWLLLEVNPRTGRPHQISTEERRVGKACVISVDPGGRRIIKTKNKKNTTQK